jgi:signal transduction histidine kinase
MFYRVNERSDGAGLGLYIAKEAVEKLKGQISVESQLGKGSKFRIEIPNENWEKS